MKKYFLLLLFISGIDFTAFAQDKNDYIGGLMTKRLLTCDDIGYNAALLIPRMYQENKIDTMGAIISYWETNCGVTEPASSLSILYAIKERTFNKQVTNAVSYNEFTDAAIADTTYFHKNIMANLYSYKYAFDTRPKNDSNLNDAEIAYRHYDVFIHDIATSLLNEVDLSPLEKFLVKYYCDPDKVNMDELSSALYDSTIIQTAYLKHKNFQNSYNGTNYALAAGMWMPQSNLSVLGSSPYLGLLAGGKRNKWAFDFNFYINFPLRNTKTYMVSNHDSLSPSNTFLGFYTGLDACYQLFNRNKNELEVIGAFALQGIQVLNGTGNSAVLTILSANPNVGLNYKLYIKHRVKNNMADNSYTVYTVHNSYIGIQAKYNFLSFNNNPGTSLSGNAFTIGIIYGATVKKRTYYDEGIPVMVR